MRTVALLTGLLAALGGAAAQDEALPTVAGELFREVLASDEMWVIPIMAPEEQCGTMCPHLRKVFSRVVKASSGMMRFGRLLHTDIMTGVSTQDGSDPIAMNVLKLIDPQTEQIALPAVLVLPPGPKRLPDSMLVLPPQLVANFLEQGPRTTYDFIKNMYPSSVDHVSTAKVEGFLTPQPGEAKHRVFVISTKPDVSLTAKKLAVDFRGRAVFGQARQTFRPVFAKLAGVPEEDAGDVSDHPLMQAYKGTTLFVTAQPLNDTAAANPGAVSWVRYHGPMAYESMREWLEGQLPSAQVPILRSQDAYKELCAEAGGICFIGVVGTDRSIRKQQLETFQAASERLYVKVDNSNVQQPTLMALPARFSAVVQSEQKQLAAAFEAMSPTVVALSPRKGRFATLLGSFDPESIRKFVLAVMEGRDSAEVMWEKVQGDLPALNTVEADDEADEAAKRARRLAAAKRAAKRKGKKKSGKKKSGKKKSGKKKAADGKKKKAADGKKKKAADGKKKKAAAGKKKAAAGKDSGDL